MKHAYKAFTLYPDEIFRVQGSSTYFTYQNTGTATGVIKGSNDAVTWFTIATLTTNQSISRVHSYTFLKLEGATKVTASRGLSTSNTSIAAYTEAEVPLASSVPNGTEIYNTTYQIKMRSESTRWIPLSPFCAYNAKLTDEVTGSTALTLLREITLPKDYIGKNGNIEFFGSATNTSNANNKTLSIRLWDGTTEWTLYTAISTTTGRIFRRTVQAAGTEYSFWSGSTSASSDGNLTSTPQEQILVPNPDLTLRVYGQLANSTDFLRLTNLTITINSGF